MHDINIVIINFKMKDDIDKCLASLFNDIKDSGLTVAVRVIDNSSNSDGIEQMLEQKYPSVKYYNPGINLGFGKAHNLGFGKARARFYLALNPDIIFISGERTLERMVKFLDDNPKAGLVGPKLLNLDGTIQNSCYRFPALFDQIIRRLNLDNKFFWRGKRVNYYLMKDFDHNRTVKVDWLMGAFILAKKELADEIGFFDDRYFMYFEDCDWSRRAWRAGWQVFYFAGIAVRHGHRRETAKASPWIALLNNRIARIHFQSWLKYFAKWGIKKEHYGV